MEINFGIDVTGRNSKSANAFFYGFSWPENPAAAVQNVAMRSGVAATAKREVLWIRELRSGSRTLLPLVCVNCWSEACVMARGEAKHHNMLCNVRNIPLVVDL